jgi:UDP-N-acetylglucosamine 2-epimerase (non-hydrolysing)
MMAFDEELSNHPTDLVVVVGDVNSTIACALVAAKRGVAIAHVEAGLRSFDRTMPEELNRLLTDQLADYLFTTERSAGDNLRAEGIPAAKIHFVGNVMIDTLLYYRPKAAQRGIIEALGLSRRGFALCTLHRPSNVDTERDAANTIAAVQALAERLPVILPLHPRTRSRLAEFGLLDGLSEAGRVTVTDPVGYLDFLALMDQARVVFTDSGGIQEETTVLGVPCLTFRENTERPITVTEGTNRVIGTMQNVFLRRSTRSFERILDHRGPRVMMRGRRTHRRHPARNMKVPPSALCFPTRPNRFTGCSVRTRDMPPTRASPAVAPVAWFRRARSVPAAATRQPRSRAPDIFLCRFSKCWTDSSCFSPFFRVSTGSGASTISTSSTRISPSPKDSRRCSLACGSIGPS